MGGWYRSRPLLPPGGGHRAGYRREVLGAHVLAEVAPWIAPEASRRELPPCAGPLEAIVVAATGDELQRQRRRLLSDREVRATDRRLPRVIDLDEDVRDEVPGTGHPELGVERDDRTIEVGDRLRPARLATAVRTSFDRHAPALEQLS